MTKESLAAIFSMTTGFLLAVIVTSPIYLTLGYYAAPELQGRIYPVVDVTLLNEGRDGDVGFWELSMRKKYNASLEAIDYYVRTSTNQHIPVPAFRCNADNTERAAFKGTPHKPGDVWRTRYCIKVTPDLESPTGTRVEGFSTYSAWPYWWETHQKTVSLTLPAAL